MASELPPWSAGDCNISETMEETKAKPENHAPALVSCGKHSQTPVSKDPTAETTREVEGSQDINLHVLYSNVEGVRDPATATARLENVQAQGDQRFLPEPHFKDLDSKESGVNENDLYETVFPSQPLRPAPPKPPPYSSSKKPSDTAGGSGRKTVLEKVGFYQSVALQLFFFFTCRHVSSRSILCASKFSDQVSSLLIYGPSVKRKCSETYY